MARVDSALMHVLLGHGHAVATALTRWLVTGEHPTRAITIDLGWPQPGAPNPIP